MTRAREIALELASWPSVTGTTDEAAFAGRLAEFMKGIPALRAAGAAVEIWPIAGDRLGRANVVAHLKGKGAEAILLSGHFDVVPVDDYGDLASLAWRPEDLAPALIERLQVSAANPLALKDLESGEFLPGRGLLDMKSGLAAGIAAMERHAQDPDRQGHMVLLATPDEEDRSVGMRAAAGMLPSWIEQNGLTIKLGINLDALCDVKDGAAGRTVAFGCIGKLLLSAFVVGQDAHACYPLAGVNSSYLTAELITELEFAPELGEETSGELASPPTVLASRDLKSVYNVTTPSRTWTIWNVLQHHRPASEILKRGTAIAERAVTRARARLIERLEALQTRPSMSDAWARIPVMVVSQVMEAAKAGDATFQAKFDAEARRLSAEGTLDYPTRCRVLTEFAWDHSGLLGPAIVLGFASMPYPAVSWPDGAAADQLAQTIRAVADAVGRRHGHSIRSASFFDAIVDMSFLGAVDTENLRIAARETPIWTADIAMDPEAATPGFPMINIGPWGRDYHHMLERVNAQYAFGTLPELVYEVAYNVLLDR